MSNFDTVVLDGEMGLFTTIREGDLPYYTGATEVTPSDQTQTLPTADTIVTSNITINPIPDIELETKSVTYTPTESEQTDTIRASSGYDAIEEVNVTVEAIDSDYVGSNVPRNDSDDLTVSGAAVTAPAGYYAANASASVASGTEGTPTAAKGAVSNHSVAVTPSVTNAAGYISGGTHTGTAVTVSASELVSGNKSITANGTNIDVTDYATVSVAVPGSSPNLETVQVSYTATESAQSDTITPSTGYDGIGEVDVTITAIPDDYVGSAIDRRDSTDLSASGATVTAPAGYYESAATKSVASGTAGTPSATKGAVSNHSVSITPSVTNTAGYISGGTLTGTAVTVDVTELESGTKSITENGTGISVSGYSAVDVNVSGGGGDDTLTKRLKNTLTTYSIDGNVAIPGYLFADCTNLQSVSFPDVTEINKPNVFNNCSSLTSVSLPELTTIGSSAQSTFERATNLSAIFPKLATIAGTYTFSRVNGPIVLPALTSLTGADTFRAGTTIVDFGPGLTSLPVRTFYSGTYTTIIFRCSTQVVALSSDSSIAGFSADTTIYIPKALYDHLGDGTALDYRVATNWTTKATTVTFACIEGSQYENYYADGTPIPTT